MSDPMAVFLALLGSFVVGSIPFAYVVGRIVFQTDIRDHGSGNVGATNVFRVFGAWPAFLVLALDMLKGFVPVAVAAWLAPQHMTDWLMVAATAGAVLGHSYTPFLGFGGGKGVATAAGALIRLTPISAAVLLPVFVVVVLVSRIVSLSSIIVVILYPVSVILIYADRPPVIGLAILAAILVLGRHHTNIRRILAGTEKRISVGRWRGRGAKDGGEDS